MLAFNYREFLQLAKQMINDSRYQNEASVRTIIGRSYYCAFLHTREIIRHHLEKTDFNLFLNVEEKIIPKGVIHNYVRTVLKKIDFKLGSKLSDLSDLRKQADYDLTFNIGRKKAEEAIILAEEIILRININNTSYHFKRKFEKIKNVTHSILEKLDTRTH